MTQQAYLADAGMALGEGRCLSAVASFGLLSVNDLAGLANLNKSQASRAAQVLVERGLVSKTAAPTDGRGVVLALTDTGAQQWQRLQPVIARRNAQITACLSADELQLFDALLDRLLAQACLQAGGEGEVDGEG